MVTEKKYLGTVNHDGKDFNLYETYEVEPKKYSGYDCCADVVCLPATCIAKIDNPVASAFIAASCAVFAALPFIFQPQLVSACAPCPCSSNPSTCSAVTSICPAGNAVFTTYLCGIQTVGRCKNSSNPRDDNAGTNSQAVIMEQPSRNR